jgi:hypothetical protein
VGEEKRRTVFQSAGAVLALVGFDPPRKLLILSKVSGKWAVNIAE